MRSRRRTPDLGELDKDSLDKMKFAMKEPEVGLREIDAVRISGSDDSWRTIPARHQRSGGPSMCPSTALAPWHKKQEQSRISPSDTVVMLTSCI